MDLPAAPPSSPDPTPKTATPTSEKLVNILVASLMLAILVSLFLPAFGRPTPSAQETMAVGDLKLLLMAARNYAHDHGDAYPPDLEALHPDYVEEIEQFAAKDAEGRPAPIRYFPGFSLSSPPESVLFEHPFQYQGKRIVGRVDGRVSRE